MFGWDVNVHFTLPTSPHGFTGHHGPVPGPFSLSSFPSPQRPLAAASLPTCPPFHPALGKGGMSLSLSLETFVYYVSPAPWPGK